jgi:hypothetical protein
VEETLYQDKNSVSLQVKGFNPCLQNNIGVVILSNFVNVIKARSKYLLKLHCDNAGPVTCIMTVWF